VERERVRLDKEGEREGKTGIKRESEIGGTGIKRESERVRLGQRGRVS